MRDIIKPVLMPIIGSLAIGLIFLLVVWSGNFQGRIVDNNPRETSLQRDLTERSTIGPSGECDDTFRPVCGMDGTTYDNTCKALRNTTTVAHVGACGQPQN